VTYLDQITTGLNGVISNLFPCERKQILGVAKSIRLDSRKPKSKIVPGVYRSPNDVTYAGFDDNYSFCSYHRLNMMNARRLPGGYGDEAGRIVLVHNMSLVICANIDDVQKTADEIALRIQFGFPDRLKPEQFPEPGFYGISFNVNSVNCNAETVFSEEFKNADFFLGPEHALLKCQYTIEATMNKRCYQKICEPQNIK
jgi:hypothetical protein